MNKVQQLQLNMLLRFDEICKKHGLRYYLAYGTCLGAVRHQGFIPWDHDVDVLMPVDDAMELEKYQNEFTPNFLVQSYRTDPSYKFTNMSILDSDHKTKTFIGDKFIGESNICMDIYLLYDLPKNKISLLLNVWRSHLHKMLVGGIPQNHGFVAKAVAKTILFLFGNSDSEKRIKNIEARLNYKGFSTEVADYYGQDVSFCNVISYKKDWFTKPTKMKFEGHEFDGPTEPDKYLTKRYGDYMTPPSKTVLENEPRVELME